VRLKGFAKSGRRKGKSLAFTKWGAELPKFWQARFYDFNVYTNEKKKEKLLYMHANPVARGLVKHPAAWIWSSYLFYEKGESWISEDCLVLALLL